MSPKPSSMDVDVEALQAALQDIVSKIRQEEDPSELNFFKQVFKKSVPFFMRSYVAAYLAKGLQVRGGFRRKFTPATLFVSIGKNRKVFPRDLVQLFVSAGKLQKSDIGDIKILDNYAFVEVDEKLAAGVISLLDNITYRGKTLTVNYAKKKAEDGSAPRERQPREPREPRQPRGPRREAADRVAVLETTAEDDYEERERLDDDIEDESDDDIEARNRRWAEEDSDAGSADPEAKQKD